MLKLLCRLLALALLLAPAASGAPMSAKDYAVNAQDEVEYQNFTCFELEWLDHFLEELRSCVPSGSVDREGRRMCLDQCTVVPGANGDAINRCNAHLPVNALTPETYDEMGDKMKHAMKLIGVGRLMDTPHDMPDMTASTPIPPQAAQPIITTVESPIERARALKNCRKL